MGFLYTRQDEVVDPNALAKDGSVLPSSDFDWNGYSIENLASITLANASSVSSPVAGQLKIEGTGGVAGEVFHLDFDACGCLEGYVLRYNNTFGCWQPQPLPVNPADVVGPGGATDEAIARFDMATGKLLQDSLATLDDAGKLTTPSLNLSGLTASTALVTDASKNVTSSTVSALELSQLFGVSSNVQSQLDGKLPTFLGNVDHAIMRTDGVGGNTVQESLLSIDDSGNLQWPSNTLAGIGAFAGGNQPHSIYTRAGIFDMGGRFRIDFLGLTQTRIRGTQGNNAHLIFDGTAAELQVINQPFATYKQMYSSHDTESGSGTAHAVDWNDANSTTLDLEDFSGNPTLTFTNPKSGANYTLRLIQSSTARTVTWPGSVVWVSGSPPTLDTAENSVTIVDFFYAGTAYYGSYYIAAAGGGGTDTLSVVMTICDEADPFLSVATDSYVVKAYLRARGDTLNFIKVIAQVSALDAYSARVYNLTAANTVAELTGQTNNTFEVKDLGTITNAPSNGDILEIQVKVDNTPASVDIASVELEYTI